LAAGRAGITKRVGVHTLRPRVIARGFCHPSLGAKDRYPGHPEPAAAKAGVLLGHKKLDTTALYTRVAINTLGQVISPLDFLLKMPG
jgi:integrase/recombinase XerD